MNGHFSRFTTDKLLHFLKRLDRKITIQIAPHKAGEAYQEVGFHYRNTTITVSRRGRTDGLMALL